VAKLVETLTYKSESRGLDFRRDTQTLFFLTFFTALYVHITKRTSKNIMVNRLICTTDLFF